MLAVKVGKVATPSGPVFTAKLVTPPGKVPDGTAPLGANTVMITPAIGLLRPSHALSTKAVG